MKSSMRSWRVTNFVLSSIGGYCRRPFQPAHSEMGSRNLLGNVDDEDEADEAIVPGPR